MEGGNINIAKSRIDMLRVKLLRKAVLWTSQVKNSGALGIWEYTAGKNLNILC